jgi:fluoride exporter
MGKLIYIGAGGFIGAVLRYLISSYVQDVSKSTGIPYGTLAVNVLGSFIIGILFFFIESKGALSPQTRAFLLVGILGALTTFSTFSIETLNLLMEGAIPQAIINLTANITLGLSAVWAGRILPSLTWW